MVTRTIEAVEAGSPYSDVSPMTGRKANPVKWWAALGAFCLCLIVLTWTRWLLDGPEPVQAGPTPMPTWQVIGLRANEVAAVVGSIIVIYVVLWKPWRRERRLTFDGKLVIGCASVFMLLDPALNYTQFWFTYNARLVNLGCPQCYLPGWQSNFQNFPEPLLYAGGFYLMALFPVAVVVSLVMRKAKQRWPRLGTFGLLGVAYASSVVFDLALEIPYIRIGTYSIGGAHEGLTFFHGHYFQFPVYESILAPLWFVAFGALRYFRNDRGESVAERGIERVKGGAGRRAALSTVAVIGMCNLLTLVYYVPLYYVAIHSEDWPADITSRSYFGVCGPQTEYACPGDRVPIVRGPDSAHARPDGTMVAPAGLPDQGTVRTK